MSIFPEAGFLAVLDDAVEVHKTLKMWGCTIVSYHTITELLEVVTKDPDFRPFAYIIDLNVGEEDGATVIPLLKQLSPLCPIIVYTEKFPAQVIDTVMDLGADDFCHKQASREEFLARVRQRQRDALKMRVDKVSYGDIHVNSTTREIVGPNGTFIIKSDRAFEIIASLASSREKIMPQEILKARVWGSGRSVTPQNFHKTIFDAREILREVGSAFTIKAVRLKGMVLGPNAER